MTTRVRTLLLVGAGLAAAGGLAGWARRVIGQREASGEQAAIRVLEREGAELERRLAELLPRDPRIQRMPQKELCIGVPTTLARDLVERLVAGCLDRVTVRLRDLHIDKEGTVRKVVTLGSYALDVSVHEVTGTLAAGRPQVRFGGDQVEVATAVRLASGAGRGTVRFHWDGKNVSGGVCGDLDFVRTVSGGVRPETYRVQGSLRLSGTATEILASPRFPPTTIRLEVVPSEASWAEVRRVLDEKEGLCGFVVDKIPILDIVRKILAKGFPVRLPTERLTPVRLPVGLLPSMTLGDPPIEVAVASGGMAITEQMLWIGADLDVRASQTTPHKAAPPGSEKPPRGLPAHK